MSHVYPPLGLEVRTPRLTLAAATDERLERLLPVVRAGVVGPEELPFDDPMSLYDESPSREWRWLRAREAVSDAFVDNRASNRVSERLGYEPNGTDWATRRGEAAMLRRWRLTRDRWTRRDDIELDGVEACRPVLGL